MYIAVGKIVQAHGMSGMVKVKAYSGVIERFLSLKTLYLETDFGTRGFILEEVQPLQTSCLLKLKGIDNRDDAQKLVKKDLLVPLEQQIDLPADHFFIHDLIDIEVVDTSGNPLGLLVEVLSNSGNDIYVVQGDSKEILIPAVAEFVKQVDVENRCMVVELIEGMLD